MENNQERKKLAEQRKQRRRIILWALAALLILMLAVMPMLSAKNETAGEQTASILSGSVEYGNIDTQIIGGGQLASEAAISLKIPEEVKLTKYLVGNGDTVKEGDPIAEVDRVSVMTAITGVQQALDQLSGEIASEAGETEAVTVKSEVGGTVKAVYAQPGDSVQDVMLKYGTLAAISLDDIMAVQIRCTSTLETGDMVCVVFSDGTETKGRVEQNLEGILTVTVEDDGYAMGESVIVLTEDGDRLGTGNLYIFNQWNAVAYSGTVSRVLVSEGKSLSTGQTLMRLEDSGSSARFQRLIDQRQEYETLMQELFQMYRTETVMAPCDGIVSGVDKDGAFLLSGGEEGFFVTLLSHLNPGAEDGFVACGVQVEEVNFGGMQLRLGTKQFRVPDMARLSDVSVNLQKMTRSWIYSGDTTVYTQSEDGLLRPDGTAKAGDVLLAVGDEEGVLWFVRAEAVSAAGTGSAGSCGISQLAQPSAAQSDIQVSMDNITGVAGYPFTANLAATGNKKGSWSVEDNTAGFVVSGNVLTNDNPSAGTYTLGVHDIYEENSAEVDVRREFTITINPPYTILTEILPDGTKGVPYTGVTLQISGEGGEWSGGNLNGLVIHPQTGVISGTPQMAGTFTLKILYTYPKDATSGEYVTVEKELTLKVLDAQQGEMPGGMGAGGFADGGFSGSGGGFSGGGGMPSGAMGAGAAVEEEDALYSLEKLTIASVVSQEHMTVNITVDELDITKIYVGQKATVTVEALGGAQFEAAVIQIANSGENEGGNSKFSVELLLEKSGQMLPGMTASVRIVLNCFENVLSIPVSALNEEAGKLVVYTSYDSETGVLGTPVEVAIGAADADNVQILTGLDAGSTFYYAYYDTLETVGMPELGVMPFR